MKTLSLYVLIAFSLPAFAQTPSQASPEQAQKAMLQQAQFMSAMFDLRKSRLGFEETISAIKAGAEKRGWKVGPVQDMQVQLREAGVKDAKRMKVVHLCPAGANEKIAKAGAGKTPPLPCRATVFDGKDGQLYVTRMNLTNLAKTLPGDLAKAMAEVGAEEEALYKNILE
ncbi:MAG: hypothetical protein B7Y41_05290 [Hydrogenophilales bacterium 28-61-23]|nr:MAG: hypothetical protein B7Y41_05290 [Hydrogenophilales bacterium 28-61-23]